MNKILGIMFLERCRRFKKMIRANLLMSIGIVSTLAYLAYFTIQRIAQGNFEVIVVSEKICMIAAMVYFTVKILNPTQEITTDHQYIQLKLISFNDLKVILFLKMVIGSIILLIISIAWNSNMIFQISLLNLLLNIYVFMRNRIKSRMCDMLVLLFLLMCLHYQLRVLSVIGLAIAVIAFILVKHCNYDNILPLYRMIYRIGQGRLYRSEMSQAEERSLQIETENLVGSAKKRNTLWQEKHYENSFLFFLCMDFSRMINKKEMFCYHFLMIVLFEMLGNYIPRDYSIVIILIQILVAWDYSYMLNRGEFALLKSGFMSKQFYVCFLMSKFIAYTIASFILLSMCALGGGMPFYVILCISLGLSFVNILKNYRCKLYNKKIV